MIRNLGPPSWTKGWRAGGLWLPSHATGHSYSRTRSIGVDMFVPHEAVFPDLPGDFQEFKRLLRTLSRTDTLFWCARINLLVSRSTDTDPKSVMYWYVQVPRVKPNLGDPDFAQYGAACIADLQAFGGR